MRRIVSILTLLAACCFIGSAEPPVTGTVRGPKGEAIEGVSVTLYLRSSTRVMLTDSKGMYRFEGLGIGSYEVTFEKEGYTPLTREVTLTFDDDTGNLDVKMQAAKNAKKSK
jgi:Carboxypeptidase regulatory-like domain